MAVPQPGIFARGTRSHYHLEFDLRPDAGNEQICAAIGGLQEPSVTVGGSNIVVGFGADLARRLIPDDIPPDLQAFPGVHGPASGMPSTPRHLGVDARHRRGRRARRRPRRPRASRRSRRWAPNSPASSTRTAATSPASSTASNAGGEGPRRRDRRARAQCRRDPHVITARARPGQVPPREVGEQQDTIGRTKPDSVRLDPLPSTSHIGQVQIEEDGEELEIYRRSVPYGTVAELGLYFVAFSADPLPEDARPHVRQRRRRRRPRHGLHDPRQRRVLPRRASRRARQHPAPSDD